MATLLYLVLRFPNDPAHAKCLAYLVFGIYKLIKNPWHRYLTSHPHGSILLDSKTSLELLELLARA